MIFLKIFPKIIFESCTSKILKKFFSKNLKKVRFWGQRQIKTQKNTQKSRPYGPPMSPTKTPYSYVYIYTYTYILIRIYFDVLRYTCALAQGAPRRNNPHSRAALCYVIAPFFAKFPIRLTFTFNVMVFIPYILYIYLYVFTCTYYVDVHASQPYKHKRKNHIEKAPAELLGVEKF